MKTVRFVLITIFALAALLPVSAAASGSTNISYGQTKTGYLNSYSIDKYAFSGSAGDVISIVMSSGEFDTYLELYGPSSQFLTFDDDSGPGFNSDIAGYKLPSNGTYSIYARAYDETESGDYAISIAKIGQGSSSGSSGSSSGGDPSVSNAELKNAVANYWGSISNKNWASAWNKTTTSFKNRKHGGSYQDYVNGYEDMQICSVSTSNSYVVYKSSTHATVAADVIYRNRSGCNRTVHSFNHYLVYDSSSGKWLLEKVLYR